MNNKTAFPKCVMILTKTTLNPPDIWRQTGKCYPHLADKIHNPAAYQSTLGACVQNAP